MNWPLALQHRVVGFILVLHLARELEAWARCVQDNDRPALTSR